MLTVPVVEVVLLVADVDVIVSLLLVVEVLVADPVDVKLLVTVLEVVEVLVFVWLVVLV